MPNSAKTIFNEIDQSFFVDSIVKGLAAVSVRTLRGPFGMDDEVITSWPQFAKKYGGEVSSYDGPSLVKRAIARGAMLRINKMGHYTTISDATTLDAIVGTIDESGSDFAAQVISSVSTKLFGLTLKNKGADYNNLTVVIAAASNGDATYFNIVITHALDSSLNETYENIHIPGNPSVDESHYLDDLAANSITFNVAYNDLSATVVALRPVNGTWAITGGTDGTAPADGDYTGSSVSKVGVYAFDRFDDCEVCAPLDRDSAAVLTAYGNYAKGRQDIVSFLHLANSNATVSALQAARTATGLDTRYAYFSSGGLKITDPLIAGATRNISELGDVIGAAMKSSAQFGQWYSFAGSQRGFIDNALGVVHNFNTTSDLDQLAKRQINVVSNKNGVILIKGNFSGQLASSRKSFMNVVKLIIFIKKSLSPIFDRYQEQPNDFRTFREIYNEVQPFLNSLKGNDKRALVDYNWAGDQFANKDTDLKVNNRVDLDQGKYHAQLSLKEVVSMQEITVDIISTPSGVSFEDNLN